jgi:deoxyadenosine/deoxycytidine kinase
MSSPKGSLFVVDGNNCAGKSSFVDKFSKKFDFIKFPENIAPSLIKFYEDPKKYGGALQTFLLRVRYDQYREAMALVKKGENVIMDRSVYSDIYFTEANHNLGNISDSDYESHIKMRDLMLAECNKMRPTLVLYLVTLPETCKQRLSERCRPGEEKMTLTYLEEVHKQLSPDNSKWAAEITCGGSLSNLVTVDWNGFDDGFDYQAFYVKYFTLKQDSYSYDINRKSIHLLTLAVPIIEEMEKTKPTTLEKTVEDRIGKYAYKDL